MESGLAAAASLPTKDKAAAYVGLIPQALSQPNVSQLHQLVNALVNTDLGPLISRQVLTEVVNALPSVSDAETRKLFIEDTIATTQPRLSVFEEQVNNLKFQLADLLEGEEEWSEAARVLTGISLESGQRSDADKLRVYIRIVRLLLEDEDSVQAETYYNRAALLVHSATDRETILQYKLCQARISDYGRKFLEAASRYLELSWVGEIDEEERRHMLLAAVTCAVLAPAGPNRSRVLASLYRDERTVDLPTYNILSKMFLDHILRPTEVQEFEKSLKPHQLAKISLSANDKLASSISYGEEETGSVSTRTGPSTVLDRAVLEHNLLASSLIYNNITFRGLGTLLDLTPGAAETMARKMIEQGRLRGHIDQVDKIIWFDGDKEEDDAQGKAGGLGDVEESEDTGAPFTKQWDKKIRLTAAHVESIVANLTDKGLLVTSA